MQGESQPTERAAAPSGGVAADAGSAKRTREAAQLPCLGVGGPSGAYDEPSTAFGAPPPCKQPRAQCALPLSSSAPFAALTAAASRMRSKLLPPLLGGVKLPQPAASAVGKGRAVLAIKAGNEGASAAAEAAAAAPLTPRSNSVKALHQGGGGTGKVTPAFAAERPVAANKERKASSCCSPSTPAVAEEPWRVSQRCRLILSDLSCAFDADGGQDNQHNSRTAQSGYCQEAFRADKAHPGDYLKGFKRLSPEARDMIVCILNKVAVQLAQQSGGQQQGKPQDSLDPRVAAVVGVAVQLFDRVMAMIHQGDVAYGASAEKKQHPLRGLAGRGGTSPLLLNQLIAIACFGFADRLEAIASTDYATIVDAWQQNTAGMLRSAWPSSLSFSETLRSKLLFIERVVVAYIAPSGNIAVAPTSELVESLLNVGYLFATAHYRCAARKAAAESQDAQQAEALERKLLRQERAEQQLLLTTAPAGEQQQLSDDDAKTADLNDPLQANPFVEALVCRGASPAVAASSALSLRVSGSSRVDLPRQVAQVFVRLALLDRNICLQFKPSTVAAAAAQLAMFHTGGASSFPPELQAALGAAAAAVAATGGSASFRLVRRCQFLMLHKWLNVKRVLLLRGAAPAGPNTAAGEYLPDRLIAEWVQRRLVLPHHRRVILAVQQHANSLVRCQALAKQQELEQAAGKPKADKEAGAGGKAAGAAGADDQVKKLKQQQQRTFGVENKEPTSRQPLTPELHAAGHVC